MKCKRCGEEESFWDEDSVPFYNCRRRAWFDAILFRCESCKSFFTAILPLENERTEIGRMIALRLRPKEVLISDVVPMRRRWQNYRLWSLWCAWAAHFCSDVGAHRRAALYALEACRSSQIRLSSNWFAWAVCLTERSQDDGLVAIAEQLLLECHIADRTALKLRKRKTRKVKELESILEKEIERLRRKLS